MISELTHRQKEIVEFVGERLRSAGTSPTVREIGQRFGIASPGAVRNHVDALLKKGALLKIPGISRGLRPAPQAAGGTPPRVREEVVRYETQDCGMRSRLPDMSWIPILGQVVAGQPLLSEETLEGHISVDRSLLPKSGSVFALKVKGDSMIRAGIHEGDLVLVRKQEDAESGDVVVGLVEGEATVKRLERKGKETWLKPENPAYRKIRFGKEGGEDRILGRVVGLIRRMG